MKEKQNQKIVTGVRQQMVRYHKLILPEHKQKKIKPPSAKKLKSKSKEFKKLSDSIDNHQQLLEFMRGLRVSQLPLNLS